jgi:hypothetical protein
MFRDMQRNLTDLNHWYVARVITRGAAATMMDMPDIRTRPHVQSRSSSFLQLPTQTAAVDRRDAVDPDVWSRR